MIPNNRHRWGDELASKFNNLPHIQTALSQGGLNRDFALLITTIESDDNLAGQMAAMAKTLNDALQYYMDSVEEKNDVNSKLQAKNDELQNLLFQLSASLSTKHLEGKSTRRITGDPDKFSGTQSDIAKRQHEYANWRSQINRSFAVDTGVFNTELRKITHIAGLLKDDACNVNRAYFDTVTNFPEDSEEWHWRTSAQVFKSLNAQYETLDLSREASVKFDEGSLN